MKGLIAALLIVLAAAPALAADWGRYVNERFGVAVDVPPGFAPGAPPVNGEGLSFSTPTAVLRAYGSMLVERDFEAEVARWIGFLETDGWAVTYQAVTPGWAVYSGKKGTRIDYSRAVPLCDGAAIGAYEVEYSEADMTAFDAIIGRLNGSLRDSGSGWQC